MNIKPLNKKKSENFSMRLTLAERRDLEALTRYLRKKTKAEALKYALNLAVQNVPARMRRPLAIRRKVTEA